MKQFIYISKFPASPEATDKQQIHFEADIAFAVSKGYEFIKSSDDMTFQIIDNNLVEVDVTEEDLNQLHDNLELLESTIDDLVGNSEDESVTEACDDCDSDYCIETHNIMLIDQVINNTLLQEGRLSEKTCNNLVKLGQLKRLLESSNGM